MSLNKKLVVSGRFTASVLMNQYSGDISPRGIFLRKPHKFNAGTETVLCEIQQKSPLSRRAASHLAARRRSSPHIARTGGTFTTILPKELIKTTCGHERNLFANSVERSMARLERTRPPRVQRRLLVGKRETEIRGERTVVAPFPRFSRTPADRLTP